MTLYNCTSCRRWHNGRGHVCGDPLPEIRDTNSLKSAVVREARALIEAVDSRWGRLVDKGWDFGPLRKALIELDGRDRPLQEEK